MSTVQYLVPITETVTGDALMTACVTVAVHPRRMRELVRAGRAASLAADLEGFGGPGRTIHVGKAVRLS